MNNDVLMPLEPAALKPGAALRILPAGSFRTKDGRPAATTAARITDWHLDASIAAQVLSVPPANAAGYVIDYEHQTLNKEKNGQPAPAAGWFRGLEWREGSGLFMAKIEWTERARTMIAGGEYRYLSPVFHFNQQTGAVTAIHSVALTNDPALIGLVDLAAASALVPQHRAETRAAVSDEDRAKFMNLFGHIPGFDIDTALAQAAAKAPSGATPSTPDMNEQDRANFKHVFGWDPLTKPE